MLLDSLSLFEKSDLFTHEEKEKLKNVKDSSPDELAVGTLKKISEICLMLNRKKPILRSKLPHIPVTIYTQTTQMPLDIFYYNCQKLGLDFPYEYTDHIETIQILQKMDHIYIDEPAKFMEDLHSIVGKLFTDIKIIIVDEKKGFILVPDTTRIRFYRITRGNPRFQVLF